MVSKTLSHYRIIRKLGAGGMGEVYLAEDTRLDRPVALKLLSKEFTEKEDRLRRFEQEARAASKLNHPNVAHIYEIGDCDGSHFIAMEYIEGRPLDELIRARSLEIADVIRISIEIADALDEAHVKGIIHRDIKPQNIMLTPRGQVKVLDFGLAKISAQEPEASEAATRVKTSPGVVMGTVNYMSPEQAMGREVDARSDIFSLGVLIYEMLAGRTPFAGESVTEIIDRIAHAQPEAIARFNYAVPQELEVIVKKALRKNRDERYQTARDMLVDLKNLKEEFEFQSKLEQTTPPDTSREPRASMISEPRVLSTASQPPVSTASLAATSTASSAEYVVNQIKRHKLVVLAALVIIALGVVGLVAYLHARNTEVAIESIAVLPFVNQSHDPESEYLSDGLTESIINSLTQLPNLRVIARSSVFRYKGRETDPLAVGHELGVRAVLVGRILQRGDQLTISTELVDVRDNKQLWGEQYERKMSDILNVQRDIAQEISSNLRTRISGAEQARVTKRYTDNPEAYQLYLKGRYFWNKRTGDDLKKSIEYFNQAIERDPNYALAYAGLADAYNLLPNYSVSSPQDSYPKAKEAARHALVIDDTLAEAHTSLAEVLFQYDWNLAESNREFQRAIELNPNYPTAHHWYASQNLLVMKRFDEAIAEMKHAQQLDPLSLVINTDLGTTYILSRRNDEAIEQMRKTVEIDPNFYYAHWVLGEAYALKGLYQEALSEYQKARALNDDPNVLAVLGHAYAMSGKRDEALKIVDQMKEMAKHRYVSPYNFVWVYIALGDNDQAFQWLERDYEDRDQAIMYLNVDPFSDPLRSDPRFAEFVRKVGLP